MVERERDEVDAANAMDGHGPPLQEAAGAGAGAGDTAAAGEKKAEVEMDLSEVRDEPGEETEQEAEKRSWSEIRLAIEQLLSVNHGGGKLTPAPAPAPPTPLFLALSHLLLQVLDKIGPTMVVLRLDVQRNIERLQELYLLDPAKYSTLADILEKEMEEGTARKSDSCARAVLWLTRSMEFTIALLQRLEEGSDQQNLSQLVEAAYIATLKPWHGWISSAAYKIAVKLLPERKLFVSLLVGKCQEFSALKDDVEKLATLLRPFLDDIHAMMAKFRLDRLKST